MENPASGRASGGGRLRPVPRGACAAVCGDATFAGIRRHLRGADSRVEEVGVVDGGPSESAWRISTHSLNGDTCVGVAVVSGGVLVRDTKDPTGSALIRLRQGPWQLFLVGLRSRPLGNGERM
ncbi:DUF397 domain-containing protein [Streptomyces sp. NPDC047081]|uniref:DUF397 domain-containing protein n=1 Tax=Streptomyces sp. NPDC047081 TaxID=3154706 RepID=UPI0033EB8732